MKNNLFKLYIADRVSAVCKNYECDGTSRSYCLSTGTGTRGV